jgi:hypothetical protein
VPLSPWWVVTESRKDCQSRLARTVGSNPWEQIAPITQTLSYRSPLHYCLQIERDNANRYSIFSYRNSDRNSIYNWGLVYTHQGLLTESTSPQFSYADRWNFFKVINEHKALCHLSIKNPLHKLKCGQFRPDNCLVDLGLRSIHQTSAEST